MKGQSLNLRQWVATVIITKDISTHRRLFRISTQHFEVKMRHTDQLIKDLVNRSTSRDHLLNMVAFHVQ